MTMRQELLELLEPWGQEHLLRFWDQLTAPQQTSLAAQIRELDLPLVRQLHLLRDRQGESGAEESPAARARGPQQLLRLTELLQSDLKKQAWEVGEALLRSGAVAAILVAGGQGSRLGFDGPKGTFPIGPVSQRSLFQVLAEQLLARSRRAGGPIPLLIMTSAATHVETVRYFSEHRYFGLPADEVHFFQQASLPALEADSHRIVLSAPDSIALSPDGHGGVLRALRNAGLLDRMQDRGIQHFYYHQVDNPTAIVCDPVFLGLHILQESRMSTKVVAKTHPHEKMGVVVDLDGQTQIIEYSDLSPTDATRVDEQGEPIFWAGNTAIHAFQLAFLQQLAAEGGGLPFHIAFKPVTKVRDDGEIEPAHPDRPNAHKFEQFIFDALPRAERALVVEADRQREFNPVKNHSGADSPETCRAALRRIAREWIEACGGRVADGVSVEISPLVALDAQDLQGKLLPGQEFSVDTVLGP